MPVVVAKDDNAVLVLADRPAPITVLGESSSALVIADSNSVTVLADNPAAVVLADKPLPITVLSGIQGPQGIPGASGNGSASAYSFAWGDATPANIIMAPAGKTIFKIEVIIKTPFDVVPSFSIGDSLNHARLFDDTDLDALSMGTYQTNPGYAYETETQLRLYLTPGGGTSAGNGIILIYMEA
jgi:hypothetical protein